MFVFFCDRLLLLHGFISDSRNSQNKCELIFGRLPVVAIPFETVAMNSNQKYLRLSAAKSAFEDISAMQICFGSEQQCTGVSHGSIANSASNKTIPANSAGGANPSSGINTQTNSLINTGQGMSKIMLQAKPPAPTDNLTLFESARSNRSIPTGDATIMGVSRQQGMFFCRAASMNR